VPFATADDVGTRLGRGLTSAEKSTAESVIATVTGLIVDEVDRDSAWAAGLTSVPAALKELCVGKAVAVLTNPASGTIAAESLGARSITYARNGDTAPLLTPQEGRLVRLAVYGTLTGSSTPRALYDRIVDLKEARDVDEGISTQ
jgi:hypothetical protein